MSALPAYIHHLLSTTDVDRWPKFIAIPQFLQQLNTFSQSNGYSQVKMCPNVVTMQLKSWSPPSYFQTKIRKSIEGGSRVNLYVVPPLARWRNFFEEKMQVGHA